VKLSEIFEEINSICAYTALMNEFQNSCVYIAPVDRIDELKSELENIVFEKDNFFICPGKLQKTFWVQNVWIDAQVEKVESIKKTAQFLKAIQRNWWAYPLNLARRTALIQETLPRIVQQQHPFPFAVPSSPLGSFALLSEDSMIYSPHCSSAIPNGEFLFQDPAYKTPSAAYLKIWEGLCRFGSFPRKGDDCIDLGSSPGSWTQALLELGCSVLSVDKANLAIESRPELTFLKKDAFKIDPLSPPIPESPKWIFSDIICYPEKLLELAKTWKAAHPSANFIFTIKFQGPWDRKIVKEFEAIPNSKVIHLYNNKHELSWLSKPASAFVKNQ